MKKLLLWVMAVLLLITHGCKVSETEQEILPEQVGFEKVPEVLNGATIAGLRFPDGTISNYVTRGEVAFDFPTGWRLIDYNFGEGTYSYVKTYTCTSKCSGGCDVIYISDNVGCSSCPENDPQSCTGKWGADNEQIIVPFADVDKALQGEKLVFVNFGVGINKVDNDSEVKELKPLPNYLLNIPEVQALYKEFIMREAQISSFNDELFSSDDRILQPVMVNFLGFGCYLNIPVKKENAKLETRDPNCSCSSGQSGCTLEEITKGFIHIGWKCTTGGCTSCTMGNIQ